jgi:hypothetical protein
VSQGSGGGDVYMLLDRSKEEIARDLLARATAAWGAERTEELRAQIDETAGWLATVGRYPVKLEGDEPDFLVAPATREEDW